MTGVLLCDAAPEVTEKAGLFIVDMTSGGDRIAVALTQSALSILAHRAVNVVAEVTQRRQAQVIPFPAPKPAGKRSRKAPPPAKAEGC